MTTELTLREKILASRKRRQEMEIDKAVYEQPEIQQDETSQEDADRSSEAAG